MPVPLTLTTARLRELCQEHGTPLQIYDEAGIRKNAQTLIKAFRNHFPNFKEFYAVKALPNPAILQVLLDEGCGLDCSSTSELHSAEALKVSGRDVMYTSNYTSRGDLLSAAKQGVVVNLDDISLVKTLEEVTQENGLAFPELVCFRLNPGLGRTDSETSSNVLGGPEAKFGVPPFQIVEGYRRAKEAGATRFGIHMMTGSCVMKNDYWQETVQVLVDNMRTINQEVGIKFEFMNIGGDLGIPYKLDEDVVDVVKVADMLRKKFDDCKVQDLGVGGKEPQLCMENGRYMTGPFGWLVTKCQAVKDTFQLYYGVDACMANLMRPGMYGSYHHITVPTAADRSSNVKNANVVGTLCENNDWFAKQRDLPLSKEGDLFVIHDTGAHSHSMGFQYNGKLRAPEVLLRDSQGKNVTLIRDRETVDVLYSNTHLLTEVSLGKRMAENQEIDEAVANGKKHKEM